MHFSFDTMSFFMKITPDQVDVFKVLNCDEQNITDEYIEEIKSLEKSGSYPPRFRLVFHPNSESKHDRPKVIKITLHSSKGTLPLNVELNGKFKGESIYIIHV